MERPTFDPKKVVVGVDGSPQAHHAAAVAESIARASGAELHLVNVVRPPDGWWGVAGGPPSFPGLEGTLKDAQREILDAAVAELDLANIPHETFEDTGDPARVLVEYCERASADLLVVGKRGAGLIERMIIGSVANRVVHDAPCPVLIVP